MVENNEKIAFDFLLPIGAACQTRYQIERYLKKYVEIEQPSCFFDWLGLGGILGVRKIIELDFNLCPEDFTVKSLYRSEHYTPIHELSGFRFQHDFKSKKENQKTEELAVLNMLGNMSDTLAKYKYLADRTKSILTNYNTIGLVYHGKINKEDVLELLNLLEFKYDAKFYLINIMNKGAENPVNSDNIISLVVDNSDMENSPVAWQGSDSSWDNALSLLDLSQIKQFNSQKNKPTFNSRNRSIDRWKSANRFYSSLTEFKLATHFSKGIHTIMLSGIPLDIHIDIKDNAPLVFVLNGATERKPELKLPVFSGFGVIPAQGISRICINDPSLYKSDDLAIGWYAGSEELVLQSLLIEVIKKIIDVANTKKVIFVGGSGGGFASLYYSKHISESLAVVWNPQTNILDYRENAVKNYAKKAFSLKEQNWHRLSDVIDVDLIKTYKEQSTKNYIVYIQNDSDWHVEKHCIPFLESYGGKNIEKVESGFISDNLYLVVNNWGVGHVPPSKAWLSSFFEKVCDYNETWDDLFSSKNISLAIESIK